MSLTGLPTDIEKLAAQKQVHSFHYLYWYNHYCSHVLVLNNILIENVTFMLQLPYFLWPPMFAALYRLAHVSQNVGAH
jgi:hypothetical protein